MAISLVPPQGDTFADYLGALRGRIDRRLARLLSASADENDLIGAAMKAALLSPGKRVRPLIVVLAGGQLGAREAPLLDLGCALEMVHAASLVLDDMPCMDDARLRRGLPTVHVRFGEDIAVLTAVALLGQAFKVISSASELPSLLRARLVGVLADAVGAQGLVRGQYQDLREGGWPRRVGEIAETNHLKTGALFAAALEMAAQVAHARDDVRMTLREAALELGQAFQLYDDLCDGASDAPLCKDLGKDAGKSTLVALLGQEAARQRLHGHVQRIDTLLSGVYGPDCLLLRLLCLLFPRLY
jgi:geranylgeranyl diphosphate synthase type II